MSAFDARALRYDVAPQGQGQGPPGSHFWGWQGQSGQPFSNHNSPPYYRPCDSTPPAIPYDFPPNFYPPMPSVMDRGIGSHFRRSPDQYPDFQNRLFVEEYRFPGPHPVYQPPHFAIHQTHFEQTPKGGSPCELDGKPLAQSIKLRGDAPEFFPGLQSKPVDDGALKTKAAKEPCWLVVSSA
ncbi:hypothetical protein BJY04DRAFT_218823 [Aspergillus karnatakaensis]|uniref:uncharacterized protein n=1 Tax=Aspergillus karnatakaensis TaxID=1810916 RepID=UPI003CCDC793